MKAVDLYKKYAPIDCHLKRILTPRRYLHSCNVAKLAMELAMRFNADPEKGFLARANWAVRDGEILQAVRDHVTGTPGMGILSRVIFLADYLEPSRGFLIEEDRQKVLHKECDFMLLYVIEKMQAYYAAENIPVIKQTRELYREIKERTKKAL